VNASIAYIATVYLFYNIFINFSDTAKQKDNILSWTKIIEVFVEKWISVIGKKLKERIVLSQEGPISV